MKNIKGTAIAGALCVTLSACGGGTASGGGGSLLTAQQQNTLESFDLATPTDPAAMPDTGAPVYVGVAAFGPSDDLSALVTNPTLVSDVTLTADFAADTIGGSFQSFRSAAAGPVPGTLTLSGGTITDNAAAANVVGDVTINGDIIDISGILVGQFTGAAAENFGGAIAATQTGASGSSDLFGVFGASQ